MDIHPPERPPHSAKDILLQLMVVTIGILIALSLEGLVEWTHNQARVREARARLKEEIRDNKRQVDEALQKAPAMVEAHRRVLTWIGDRLAHREPSIHNLSLGYAQVLLSDSSWRTAEATGVLAHMAYAEVQKYADVYALQGEAMRLQRRTVDVAVATAHQIEFEDLDRLTDGELEHWRQQVIAMVSQLRAEQEYGKALSDRYREALAGP